MCIIGNPPYAVSSTNKGEWIENLVSSYKNGLDEQNKNSLSDDYVKFIRFGQHFVEKNGSGIVAYISNNSFLDGLIHRQMREELLKTFDKFYIINLHGNSKKQETTPDGSIDQNVFDIMQGVSINLLIKNAKSTKDNACEVLYKDLYGKRSLKYEYLEDNDLSSIEWINLNRVAPNFYFVPKEFRGIINYENGFKINNLFSVNGSGVKFRKDNLLVKNHFSSDNVKQMLSDINNLNDSETLTKYSFKETKDWSIIDFFPN
jgi:predicted helicase